MLRPIGDKLIVKVKDAESVTPGGIVLPDAAKEKSTTGEVVRVGEGRILDNGSIQAMRVSCGDEVLFRSYAGIEIEFDGEKLLVLSESDILAVI